QAAATAAGGSTGATTAASTPSSVAGATAGATRAFAGTETRLVSLTKPTSTGMDATCAASGTATASASGRGSHGIASRHTGASMRMPAVDSTDSEKPTLRPSQGSIMSKTTTVAASAGNARLRPATLSPRTPIMPMVAALTTLGSG